MLIVFYLGLVGFVLDCAVYASPIPKRTQKKLALSYLSDCEQKLQLQCIEVFGTKSYFPADNTCKPEPLINCLKFFMKTVHCKENDPGTIPYVKDFLHRLKRKYIVKGVCLNKSIRTELQELFQVPDDFHVPAVHPQTFGSGKEEISRSKQKSMYYDDTEPDDQSEQEVSSGEDEDGSSD